MNSNGMWLALALFSCAGCAAPAVAGEWAYSTAGPSAGSTIERALVLEPGGSARYRFTGGGACTGSVEYIGFAWTEEAASSGPGRAIRFSGSATCTGRITCGAGASDCNDLVIATVGSCPYTLTDGQQSLTLTNCFGATNATNTFARQ